MLSSGLLPKLSKSDEAVLVQTRAPATQGLLNSGGIMDICTGLTRQVQLELQNQKMITFLCSLMELQDLLTQLKNALHRSMIQMSCHHVILYLTLTFNIAFLLISYTRSVKVKHLAFQM